MTIIALPNPLLNWKDKSHRIGIIERGSNKAQNQENKKRDIKNKSGGEKLFYGKHEEMGGPILERKKRGAV
jgi:hypothetical protein